MNNLTDHPDAIFWLIGVLVLANLGSIAACIMAALKVVWWASKMDLRVEIMEKSQKHHVEDLDRIVEELGQLKLAYQRRDR